MGFKINVEGFKQYIDSRNYSPCTKQAYLGSLEDYMRHGFTEISTELENEYREQLKKEGKKGKTVNLRIHSLNVYNRYVGLPKIDGVKINEDPFATNGMDLNVYFELLDHLLEDKKYNWYIIIKILACTGMRIGEALHVTFGDFRRGSCLVYGKGGKPRTIYFSHSLQETLHMYVNGYLAKDQISS